MTIAAGILDLLVLVLGSWGLARGQRRAMLAPSEMLACRLVIGFALFFLGFALPGALQLLFGGRWVTIPNAASVGLTLTAVGYAWNGLLPSTVYVGVPAPIGEAPPAALNTPTRLVVGALMGGFALILGLVLIGFPRGFEVHAYHLPIAVNIFRDGSLRIWDRAFMHTYPANMSLWSGFWLQLLPERVVSIVNFPFLGLCVFFLYRLCRLAGADRSAAALVACGIATIPLFAFSAAELGADVAGVGFILAAIWLVLAHPKSAPAWPVLAGAASGLAFGFKPPHLVAATLIGLWILCDRGLSGEAPSRLHTRLLRAAGYTAAFLALAGVWLLRNQLELDNPIYPLSLPPLTDFLGFKSAPDFRLQDRQFGSEWVGAAWQWLIYPWVEGHYLNQNYKFSSGLGPFVAATLPAAWLLWSVMLVRSAWRRDRSDANRAALALYIFGTATLAVWWLLGDRQPRFAMAGLAELLPLAAVLLAAASGAMRRAYEVTLGLGIVFMLAVTIVKLGVEEGSLLRLGRLPSRAEALEYPRRLDELPAATVVLDLQDRPSHYGLYGVNLTNRVISNPEAIRLFREDDAWNLKPGELRRLGVAYVYAEGDPKLSPGCVRLDPAARLDRNPFNSLPLPAPRILYRIEDNCPQSLLDERFDGAAAPIGLVAGPDQIALRVERGWIGRSE